MEKISALMDGELDGQEADREFNRLREDPAFRSRWDEFHLIGDALRGEPRLSAGFNAALALHLAKEPTILAPQRISPKPRRFTTYALSAAASLSAAALVAWVALSPPAPIGPQANAPAVRVVPAVLEAPPASVPNEGRMNEYLLAHQGFSPSTALQGLAPYIRSVSATRPADGR